MTAKRNNNQENSRLIYNELIAIKRLLILQLITSGVQAKDIALALGVNKMAVSRLVATRKVKKPISKK